MAARAQPPPNPENDRPRFDGGAPWLDLLASRELSHGPEPIERLSSPVRLSRWLEAERLGTTGPPVDEADLAAALALREALRRVTHAVLNGTVPDVGAIEEIHEHAHHGETLALRVRPTLERVAPLDTREALGRLARAALEDLTGPLAGELRACAAEDCRMVFRDPTGRRRWCDPTRCGTRTRVRSYRDRQRAQM
jgi:predicted RNA-binding Zn ribbon-like protein